MQDKDLEQIEKVVEKAVKTGLGEFWEGNLEPAFNGIHENISDLGERLTIVERKLDKALYREFQRIDNPEKDMGVVKEKSGIS